MPAGCKDLSFLGAEANVFVVVSVCRRKKGSVVGLFCMLFLFAGRFWDLTKIGVS